MFTSSFVAVALVAPLLSLASPTPPGANVAGAVYTLDNDSNGASIVAIGMYQNGTLYGDAVYTSTGGKGSDGHTGPGQPNVGSLFGSDAIASEDGYIFAVNAGSDTVSMMRINSYDPLHPVLVGQPAATLGDFPMSLAYSSKLCTLCVLNGGAKAGVTCFSVDPVKGLSTMDTAPRSISQGLKQSTPPVGPFSTASDIRFNPSSSGLFVSTKGSPLTKSPGYIFSFPITNGMVSENAIVNHIDSLILDFSLSFTGTDYELLITDPALGADILTVSSDLKISVANPVNITYQKAACWSYYEPKSKSVFVADAAQSNITVVSAVDGSITGTLNYMPQGGGQDMTVAMDSLYVLSSKGYIVNFDIAGMKKGYMPKQTQAFDPLSSGQTASDKFAGLASYVYGY